MSIETQPTIDQAELWNGPAARAWVDQQEMLDRVLKPVADRLKETVEAARPARLLDVGCGTGTTTLEAARLLGSAGRCVGVDISGPMLAAARTRADREGLAAEFLQADAQTHAFEPGDFDMLISRFGVMFFGDPVAAFANLGKATQQGGRLAFVAWRGAAENPFMTAAERAAAPLLPGLPPRRPDAPGQFAFADPERVGGILREGGWDAIDIRPVDFACSLPEAELQTYVTRMGPVGMALAGADPETRTRIVDAVMPAFAPFVIGSEVRFTAACWEVSARLS